MFDVGGMVMSLDYAVNEEMNFVYVKARGPLDRENMITYEASFIADQRVRPGFKALFDASQVRGIDLDPQVIAVLLNMELAYPDKFKGSKRAFLLSENLGWDNAKTFAEEAEGNNIVLFSLDVALVWLGVTIDDIPVL